VAGAAGVTHARFADLGRFLEPGDLVVVNTSGTMAAEVDARWTRRGAGTGAVEDRDEPVVVHFSTRLDDGRWVLELRTAPDGARPIRWATAGDRLEFPGGARATLLGGFPEPEARPVRGASSVRLWRAQVAVEGEVDALLARVGRPIRYGYVPRRWPLEAYQTVFATEPGSAEMPSAGRPFTTDLVTRLVAAGVTLAPIVLHTGVSSPEAGEPPAPERFAVPLGTARLVELTRRHGGRVIAVGTTVTRALESAAGPDGRMGAAAGWTDLVLGPDRRARVVDGIVTGLHAPDASHLLLLEAVAGPEVVAAAYAEALRHRYLWHEFGDTCLLLHPAGAGAVAGAGIVAAA